MGPFLRPSKLPCLSTSPHPITLLQQLRRSLLQRDCPFACCITQTWLPWQPGRIPLEGTPWAFNKALEEAGAKPEWLAISIECVGEFLLAGSSFWPEKVNYCLQFSGLDTRVFATSDLYHIARKQFVQEAFKVKKIFYAQNTGFKGKGNNWLVTVRLEPVLLHVDNIIQYFIGPSLTWVGILLAHMGLELAVTHQTRQFTLTYILNGKKMQQSYFLHIYFS